VLFLVVKGINRMRAKEEPQKTPEAPADVKLLTEIRDILAKRA
jgi:large conductance mechanosensitive channel